MTTKDLAEAFRKAMVEVLIPEIKVMQGQLDRLEKRTEEHGKILQEHDRKLELLIDAVHELQRGQDRILDKLDLDKRVTRLETLMENMRRSAGTVPAQA